MERHEIAEIMAVFEGYREKFPYVKDGFALTRILDETGDGKAVRDIRKGPNGRFLSLPLLRDFIARAGGGKLTPELFFYNSPDPTDLYIVTLDKWGNDRKYWGRGWDQMARPGFNLVVQLNLSGKHLEKMRRVDQALVDYVTPVWTDHPVRSDGAITVSWARIDMDVMAGVALIEEIQSDWVRETADLRTEVRTMTAATDTANTRKRGWPRRRWLWYLDSDEFRRIEKHWPEATLEATCQFLRREVGITDIYLYDFDTGCRFKDMGRDYCRPPRSLYTSLPKRYGMERVEEVPAFLLKKRDRHLRKAMRAAPAVFWKLPDARAEADEPPPGSGPGRRSIIGSGNTPLPDLTIRVIAGAAAVPARRLH